MEKTQKKLLTAALTKAIYETLSASDIYAAKLFQDSIKAASKVLAKDFLKTCEELNNKSKNKTPKNSAASKENL